MNIVYIFIFFLFCSISYKSNAAIWSFDFNVKQDIFYDDNVTLTLEPEGSLSYKIIPTINMLYKTEVAEVKAEASYGYQLYTDIEGFDSTIQQYGINGNYFTEKTSFGLSAGYSVRPSRDTAGQDSGDFDTASDKTTKSISPFFYYKLTEYDVLVLQTNYTENTFSTEEFDDNNNQNVRFNWERQWTQRYSGGVSFFFSRFEFKNNNNFIIEGSSFSNNYGVSVSGNFLLTENWIIITELGWRFTETENILINGEPVNSSSNGFITNTSINYTGENYLASLFIIKSIIPSSIGELEDQTSLGLGFEYLVTERISALFSANYLNSTGESSSINVTSREIISFKPSINWEISQHLLLSGSYQYKRQKGENNAASNLFMLSISYDWPGLSVSR